MSIFTSFKTISKPAHPPLLDKKPLFLHIGSPKTGTTSIQSFCGLNRKLLLQNGILYPQALGNKRHVKLSSCFSRKMTPYFRKQQIKTSKQKHKFREDLSASLFTELTTTNFKYCIISDEGLFHYFKSKREVKKLKHFLLSFFSSITIIVYLRPQHEIAQSWYSTALKSGSTQQNPIDTCSPMFNYNKTLKLFEKIFGILHIQLRLYNKNNFPHKNIIYDFFEKLSLDVSNFTFPPHKNLPMGSAQQKFMIKFNHLIPVRTGNTLNPHRTGLIKALNHYRAKDAPISLSKNQAITFYNTFSNANKKISKRYFNKKSLFNIDFDQYHTSIEADELPVDDALDIASHLWIYQVGLNNMNKEKISTLKKRNRALLKKLTILQKQ